MNNQECKVRPEIFDVSNNNPLFYPFSIKTTKCKGNCIVIALMIHMHEFVFLITLEI